MSQILEKNDDAFCDYLTLHELIDLYERANITLLNAIENDLEDSIEQHDCIIAKLTDKLMNFECQTEQAEKILLRFLIKNFSFPDPKCNSLTTRASNRVLGSWLLQT